MAFKNAVEHAKTWNNKDLTPGAVIEGYYIKKEVVKTDYGENTKFLIKLDDGTLNAVYGSASLINQFMNVPENCRVKITFNGEERSKKGRKVKSYTVQYDDEDTVKE